ncbi:MAG: hypothetical protein ACRDYB_08245 [Acidimicrobiales bacterium]
MPDRRCPGRTADLGAPERRGWIGFALLVLAAELASALHPDEFGEEIEAKLRSACTVAAATLAAAGDLAPAVMAYHLGLPLPRIERLPLRGRAGVRGRRGCENQPVRTDYLDDLVWRQVTALLADPSIVQGELDRRLAELRTANPATAERSRLERELTRTTTASSRLLETYQEATLVSLDELRAPMPPLRSKEASLRASVDALDAQLLDRDPYLKLAEDIESFLGRLRETADNATTEDRRRVLRSVVKEVLVGPERVVIRHTIPVRDRPFRGPGSRLCLRSPFAAFRRCCRTSPYRSSTNTLPTPGGSGRPPSAPPHRVLTTTIYPGGT